MPARGERLEVSPTNPGSKGGRRTGPNRVGRTDGDIASGVLPSCGELFTKHDAYVKIRRLGGRASSRRAQAARTARRRHICVARLHYLSVSLPACSTTSVATLDIRISLRVLYFAHPAEGSILKLDSVADTTDLPRPGD